MEKYYRQDLCKKISYILFAILILTSIFTHINKNAKADSNNEMEWDFTIIFSETTDKMDNIIFGESLNASDGQDNYDAPNPGGTPTTPYLDAYFTTSFPYPHDTLMQEIKHYTANNTYKDWNFSIFWFPSDYSLPTNVTISWEIEDVFASGYNINLYCNNISVANMTLTSSYTYESLAMERKQFKIVCERPPNNPPNMPSKPWGETEGYHGISYTYNTSTIDSNEDNVHYLFDWNDGTNSGWMGPYSSGEICSSSHIWESPGTYHIRTEAKDRYGAESNWSSYLVINMSNRAPNIPTNPQPSDNSTGVGVNEGISWTGGDPDPTDILTYDIYFGDSNPPPKIISNKSTTSFDPGTMSYNDDYYWKIIAWDGYGLKTTGPLWSFKTESSSNGENGGYPPGNGGENILPVANASASDTFGFVGSIIVFNGSLSSDSDGYITSWSWDFGDGVTKSGEITTHEYSGNGTYAVKLTVTDDGDATDTDTVFVVIGTANNPPSIPIVNGATSGNADTKYTYTATSTDRDNDSISYTFDWGDSITNISDFLPNGTSYTTTHEWATAGIYTINVTATDNETTSKKAKLIVLIDAEYVKELGYLLDSNGDTIYDSFFSNTTITKTSVKQEGENYSIDINGDGNWDYVYNSMDGTINPVKKEKETTGNTSSFPTEILLVMCMALIIIVVIVYLYKKEYF